jgi:hypothetical protein
MRFSDLDNLFSIYSLTLYASNAAHSNVTLYLERPSIKIINLNEIAIEFLFFFKMIHLFSYNGGCRVRNEFKVLRIGWQ